MRKKWFVFKEKKPFANLHLSSAHRRLAHGTTPATRVTFSAGMLAEARYHRCRHPGCGRAVLCDRRFITQHLHGSHGRQRLTSYYGVAIGPSSVQQQQQQQQEEEEEEEDEDEEEDEGESAEDGDSADGDPLEEEE